MESIAETTHCNNKQNLIDAHKSKLELYRSLQFMEEGQNQEIYNCKREVTRLKTLQVEYVSEIESIQSHSRSECEALKLKVQALENQRNDLIYQHAQHTKGLTQTIQKADEQICILQNELESIKNTCNIINNKTTIDQLQFKNTELEDVACSLENEKAVLADKASFLEHQCLMDAEQNKNLKENLNTLNERYKQIKKEIEEKKHLNENLQEDLILSKQELDTVKSKPLQDGSQGNSLFAEVDNKRLELEDRMALMESQYLKMKNEHTKLLSEIATLNSAKAGLCQKWETESKENINDNEIEEQGYREQITLLESQLDMHRNEILSTAKITSTNTKPGGIQFMENMLEAKHKEVVEVLKQDDQLSQSKISIYHELRETNRKIRSLRAKATKFDFEIEKLQTEIENLKWKEAQLVKPAKSKKSILKDVDNAIAYLKVGDDGCPMIDYSRQIKRSRLKSDRNSKSIGGNTCEPNKNSIEIKKKFNL